MTTTAQEATCPNCGGPTWDNRLTKRNPKQPDFKCKDRGCDGVIWPPKNGASPYALHAVQPHPTGAKPTATVKQAYSAGPALPYENQETGAPPAGVDPLSRLNAMFSLYDVCLDHAHAVAVRRFGNDVTDTAVAAMAATLYIQANQRGLGT